MDKELIDKYRKEMLDTYLTVKPVLATPPQTDSVTLSPPESVQEMAESVPQLPEPVPESPEPVPESLANPPADSSAGKLIAIVTAIRSLYPVEGAKVTVFTGTPDSKNIIATATTDQSGRTDSFILPAPARQLSLDSNNNILPYALYNMLVEAEGYVDTIHLNIPVFSGTTSLQRSNMMLLETAGENTAPRIFDEAQQYTL